MAQPKQKRARLFEQPFIFGSSLSLFKLLWENKSVDRKYISRVMFVILVSVGTLPMRMYESLRYGRAVRKTAIQHPPIFIIGHWRTGTTHLHNLLCQSKNLGRVSMWQAFAPGICLIDERFLKNLFNKIAKKMHPTREIDNIPLSLDNPEEEDLAIANMSPYSYLHMYTFPRRASYYFKRYVTNFDVLPGSIRKEWGKYYMTILRKATLKEGGKRLVIKNCSDSARIKALLELFPDAKFIHTYRNPYDVFRSTQHLYRTVLERAQVQEIDTKELETWVLQFYTQLMQKLFADKSLIPKGNLVEVKYEDLDKEPLAELRKIYETLGLPGFTEAEPAFRTYLDSIKGYQRNLYKKLEDNLIIMVNQNWDFARKALGYQRIEPAGVK